MKIPVYDTRDKVELARQHLHQDMNNISGLSHEDVDTVINYIKAKL